MHGETVLFYQRMVPRFIDSHIKAGNLIEFGSLNINGSARTFFVGTGWKSYLGIDMNAGVCATGIRPDEKVPCACNLGPADFPCVQIRAVIHLSGLPAGCADLVLGANQMEHDPHLVPSIQEAARLLRPGGVYLFSTVSPAWGEHELWTTGYYKSPVWADIRPTLDERFSEVHVERDDSEIQGWAIR